MPLPLQEIMQPIRVAGQMRKKRRATSPFTRPGRRLCPA
jgi:hypothetical protein